MSWPKECVQTRCVWRSRSISGATRGIQVGYRCRCEAALDPISQRASLISLNWLRGARSAPPSLRAVKHLWRPARHSPRKAQRRGQRIRFRIVVIFPKFNPITVIIFLRRAVGTGEAYDRKAEVQIGNSGLMPRIDSLLLSISSQSTTSVNATPKRRTGRTNSRWKCSHTSSERAAALKCGRRLVARGSATPTIRMILLCTRVIEKGFSMQRPIVSFVLAGGRGNRLYPLTQERAKPAVPFGGKYRIIDFVLSNLINSGIYSIYVLVQFMSQSLLRHLRDGWQFGGLLQDQFIIPVPAQMRSTDETWYRGTADAIFQNLNLMDNLDDHLVAIFGADHVYRMNIRHMIDFHERMHADVTVAAIPVSAHLASEFGVIEAGLDGAVHGFHEKNADAPTIPGEPDKVYASMGNYIFSARTLLRELQSDALRPESRHDFGHDILPSLLGRATIYAYDYQTNVIPGESAAVQSTGET